MAVFSTDKAANEKYSIDTKGSVITWKGGNVAGSNTHTGYISISKGALTAENGQLVGGTAEVDMNTMSDESHDSDSGLISHLKNPDFFDVERFPSAKIVLTKVVPANNGNSNVTGNLTIKGITHPVTFPAKIEVKVGILTMNGKLVIDRTLWDINYKSGKLLYIIADEAISDSIEFYIKIVAKK
ncbi:YceI family protein [Flavobacterium sp. RHBU_24]|uniref:YceI family protein n=1 Tax=Flavobacterium sp. RHBU_24 TaxID=3391185 RepID=UPI0039849F27